MPKINIPNGRIRRIKAAKSRGIGGINWVNVKTDILELLGTREYGYHAGHIKQYLEIKNIFIPLDGLIHLLKKMRNSKDINARIAEISDIRDFPNIDIEVNQEYFSLPELPTDEVITHVKMFMNYIIGVLEKRK